MAFTAAKYSADLATGVLTDITGGGVAVGGTYLLCVANRVNNTVAVSIAVTTGGAPVLADYIEYQTQMDGSGTGGIMREWPIPLGQGWRVYAQASSAGVSISILGATS
jgi:hypothetical protein